MMLFFLVGCGNNENMKINVSGYKGQTSDWDKFLSCWENEIVNNLSSQAELYTPEEQLVYERKSSRYPPASLEEIKHIEKKLNVSLPKSYVDFLKASNGWIQVHFDASDGLVFPIEKIGWLREKNNDLIADWFRIPRQSTQVEDVVYFNYTTSQDASLIRDEYLEHSLVISEVVDSGVYLLNPKIITEDGEWEAWFFGWELPGAIRFKSFAQLMRYAYFKAAKEPDYDGIYSEEELSQTCAKLIPVS